MRNPFKPRGAKRHRFILEGEDTKEYELIDVTTSDPARRANKAIKSEAVLQFRVRTGEAGRVIVHEIKDEE